MTTDETCTVTGTVGVIVQLALAVLVLVVLITEYLVEQLKYQWKKFWDVENIHKPRKLRTFWFDSFKICTGALVSHAFNIITSILVTSATTSNECAVYALTFYYEACGVPFVQLLQYGIIQYARQMSKDNNITKRCRDLWQYIALPGIYDKPNRYTASDLCCSNDNNNPHRRSSHHHHHSHHHHSHHSHDSNNNNNHNNNNDNCRQIVFYILLGIALGLSLIAGYFFYLLESGYYYIDFSVILLVFIFIVTAYVAPTSSLIQTVGWVVVKGIEKSVWSLLVLAQTNQFAEWSLVMGTGSSTTDAWLFIAVIPIIMNAFMFFMFSRISRLKIPCLDVKFRHKLDAKLEKTENEQDLMEQQDMYGYNSNSNSNSNSNMSDMDINGHESNNENINMIDNDYNNPNQKIMIHSNDIHNDIDNNIKTSSNYNILNEKRDINDRSYASQSEFSSFDLQEAIRVGIIYALIINVTLLILAIAYLIVQKGEKIWILSITMVIVPLVIGLIGIFLFRYLVDNRINLCCCCLVKNNNLNNNNNYKNDNGYGAPSMVDED